MNNYSRYIYRAACIVFLTAFSSLCFSLSDNSVTEIPAEGNGNCNDYSENGLVLSMTGSLSSTLVTGDANPSDDNSDPETVAINIRGSNTIFSFSGSTTGIDYVVIKGRSRGDVKVFFYESGGVVEDDNMIITSASGPVEIASYQLCYALGNEPREEQMEEASVTPQCSGADLAICGTAPDRIFINCSANLDVTAEDFDLENSCCVCNNGAPLDECNPALGEFAEEGVDYPLGAPGPCTDSTKAQAVGGFRVPVTIMFDNDPYYCRTIGGRRKCYKY
jgi:hypothetical protein